MAARRLLRCFVLRGDEGRALADRHEQRIERLPVSLLPGSARVPVGEEDPVGLSWQYSPVMPSAFLLAMKGMHTKARRCNR